MGLDMYAFKSKIEPKHPCNFRDWYHPLTGEEKYYTNRKVEEGAFISVTLDVDAPTPDEQIGYWRKYHRLHEWIRERYDAYDGKEGDVCHFNQNSVELSKEMIEELRDEVKNDNLPCKSLIEEGWYGGDAAQAMTKAADLVFIETALQAIEDGFYVYYTSWW